MQQNPRKYPFHALFSNVLSAFLYSKDTSQVTAGSAAEDKGKGKAVDNNDVNMENDDEEDDDDSDASGEEEESDEEEEVLFPSWTRFFTRF